MGDGKDVDSGSMDILSKIEAGFTALDVTVNDLLNFSSHREPHWHSFSVRELVDEICEALGPQLDAQSIQVSADVPLDAVVEIEMLTGFRGQAKIKVGSSPLGQRLIRYLKTVVNFR